MSRLLTLRRDVVSLLPSRRTGCTVATGDGDGLDLQNKYLDVQFLYEILVQFIRNEVVHRKLSHFE